MNSSMPGSFDTYSGVLLVDRLDRHFDVVHNTAQFHKLFSILTRRPYRLLDLNSFSTQKNYGHFAGQWEINLDQIRGTEGRQNDFDDRFDPLTDQSRRRWVSIAQAYEQGIDLPPVELIQVGEIYFVRDGHHRISVARAFGRKTINARVTVW